MKPIAAAVLATLISGTTMYLVGSRTSGVDAASAVSEQLVAAPVVEASVPAPRVVKRAALRPATYIDREAPARVVTSPATVVQEQSVTKAEPGRTWKKTALIIGGSTASGAGVGALIGGKKGAIAGAVIGGGAASIYEATQRN